MENLNDNVCIFPESLRSNEGATAREIGSSELRGTSHPEPATKIAPPVPVSRTAS
jgi:hypothetical protein